MEVASGSVNGATWTLEAAEHHGQLCLVMWAKEKSGARTLAGDGCGFDNRFRGSTYYTGAAAFSAAGQELFADSFGPVPNNATQVRIAANEVVATVPFPAGKGLPRARFWVHVANPNLPSSTSGKELTPEPEDEAGHPVPFADY
jgi:hypothetical protein